MRLGAWLGTVMGALVLPAGCTKERTLSPSIEDGLRRLMELGGPKWALALGALKPEQFDLLRRHPLADLQSAAARLVRSETPEQRAQAVYLMVVLWQGMTNDTDRTAVEAQLAPLLGDGAPEVRAMAADAVVWLHFRDAGMPLPGAALAVVREGLQAADEGEQLAALSTAMLLGREVGPLRGTLLELLRSPSPAIRRFARVALMRVRPLDPELQHLRQQWLEAAANDFELPYAALAWYELSPAGGGAAIPRILQLARDPAGADDLRAAALQALARLVTTPADAEPVLALLLARDSALSPEARVGWSRQVAQLAVHLSDSPAVAQATALLQAQWAADPDDIAAAAALVRIAATHRRSQPEPAHVALLRAEVRLLASLQKDGSLPGGPSERDRAAIEGCVALATWPGSGVTGDELRRLLTEWVGSARSQCQDWAQELLDRLPK